MAKKKSTAAVNTASVNEMTDAVEINETSEPVNEIPEDAVIGVDDGSNTEDNNGDVELSEENTIIEPDENTSEGEVEEETEKEEVKEEVPEENNTDESEEEETDETENNTIEETETEGSNSEETSGENNETTEGEETSEGNNENSGETNESEGNIGESGTIPDIGELDPLPETGGKSYIKIGQNYDDNKLRIVEDRLKKASISYIITASGMVLVGPYDNNIEAFNARKSILGKGFKGVVVQVN